MINTNKENGFRSLLLSVAVVALTFVGISASAADIVGHVRDAQGEPVIGASVTVQGTTTGTVTDLDGMFVLSCDKNATLEVSSIGYKSQEVRAHSDMVVMLKEDVSALDEVVVVGYGTQKKANLTGAVTSVDVERQLESKPETDVAKALQGAVPGLTITNTNGDLNGDPTVVIRGIGTLSNSGTSTPLYIVDGVPMDNLSYLNPNDIESISVLKDASASSIYGTRAAFGVILITTKTAKTSEKVSVSYSNNFAWSRAAAMPDYPTVMEQVTPFNDANHRMGNECELFGMYSDSEHFIEMATKWQEKHGGKSGYREMVYGDDYDEFGYYADWDVAGIMFNNAAPAQSHNLSVSGNSGKTNYYMSFNWSQKQGIMNFNPDKLQKYNATVNLTTQATKWLEIGARFNMNDRIYDYPYVRGQGSYTYVWRWGSYFGPYGYFNIDGKNYDGRQMIGFRNQGGDAYKKRMNIRTGANMKITFCKGFTLNADYTFTYRTTRYKGIGTREDLVGTWSTQGANPTHGSISTSDFIETDRSFYYQHTLNAYLNYNATWKDAHHFNAMVGMNMDKDEYEYLYYERHDIQDFNLPELALCASDYSYEHSHNHHGSIGMFARINYDYKGIYLFEISAREDASSKLKQGAQWAFFPSGSVGYRISEEPYFENAKQHVSNLKLRASYGVIGNQEIGSNMFLETMSKQTASVWWIGDGSARYDYFSSPKLVAESLTWEKIATANVGIDLGFLNNDLNVNFDWFQRDTKDMLAPGKAMPSVIGASSAYENAGSLRTRGWELTIGYNHIFKEADNLEFHAMFNLSDYKTKVTEWDSNNLINGKYAGKEWGEIWGFKSDRYFTPDDFNEDGTLKAGIADQSKLESGAFKYQVGDMKFVDVNGDGKIDAGAGTPEDHGDLVKIGNNIPRFEYSLRAGLAWKGFDLDLYFQGVGKRDMWTQSAFVMPFTRGTDAIYSNQTSYVSEAEVAAGIVNQNADFPRMWAGGGAQGNFSSSILDAGKFNFYPQDKYLVNLAYLRLKNLTVGYTIPQRLTRKATIEKIRIYASFDNLADLVNHTKQYGLDPEMNANASVNGTWGRTEPIYRTYSFGLQVSL